MLYSEYETDKVLYSEYDQIRCCILSMRPDKVLYSEYENAIKEAFERKKYAELVVSEESEEEMYCGLPIGSLH